MYFAIVGDLERRAKPVLQDCQRPGSLQYSEAWRKFFRRLVAFRVLCLKLVIESTSRLVRPGK